MGKDYYQSTSHAIKLHYEQEKEKTDKEIKEEVSLQLQLFRRKHGLTLDQLAKEIGVSKIQVIRWEKQISKPNQIAILRLKDLKILK